MGTLVFDWDDGQELFLVALPTFVTAPIVIKKYAS